MPGIVPPLMRPMLRLPARRERGFTMLELIMAMAVFTILGAAAVMLMRQGLSIFAAATRDTALHDRMESVLPPVEDNLHLLSLPATFDPPPPAPSEEERLDGVEWVPPPPVDVRLRSQALLLRDLPDSSGLKGIEAFYAAWVVDISGVRSDPLIRGAGDRASPDLKDLNPEEEESDAVGDTLFKPTGGLREVCYIAVPGNPEKLGQVGVQQYPALLTLYEGWRSPVGGEGTLLDPNNLDTVAEIRKACRPVAEGLLHFGILWRRVFPQDRAKRDETPGLTYVDRIWEETKGNVGETEPYVGRVWDSTRALDKKFGLHVGPSSLGDPSDDIFPAWARLEVTLIAPSVRGLGRGETYLVEGLNVEDLELYVADITDLVGPGPDQRLLKINGEWMSYRVSRVNARLRHIPIDQRGARGTKPASHQSDSDVYAGLSSRRDVRLLYRDRYAKRSTKQR